MQERNRSAGLGVTNRVAKQHESDHDDCHREREARQREPEPAVHAATASASASAERRVFTHEYGRPAMPSTHAFVHSAMETKNSGRNHTSESAYRRSTRAMSRPAPSSRSGPRNSKVHSTDVSTALVGATMPVSQSPSTPRPTADSTGRWNASKNIVVSIFSGHDNRLDLHTSRRKSRQTCWWPRAQRYRCRQ